MGQLRLLGEVGAKGKNFDGLGEVELAIVLLLGVGAYVYL